MGDRTPFVVGILAIVAVVAWLVLRGDSAQPVETPPAPSARAGSARINAPEGPSLSGSATKPELPSLSTTPSADDVFVEEDRDDAWAAKTEAEIAKRWKDIRGAKLASSECKRTQCRLVVSGAEPEVATAIADLEGPRGMHGFAENVLLTNPSKAADGTVALHIYVRFER